MYFNQTLGCRIFTNKNSCQLYYFILSHPMKHKIYFFSMRMNVSYTLGHVHIKMTLTDLDIAPCFSLRLGDQEKMKHKV